MTVLVYKYRQTCDVYVSKSIGEIVVQISQCTGDGALSTFWINVCWLCYFKNVVQNCPEFCHAQLKLQYDRIFLIKK